MEKRIITQKEFDEAYKQHQFWLGDVNQGNRLSFLNTDLRSIILPEIMILRGADLRGADLRGVDLRGVGLREADLEGADLRGADLRGVGLREADLEGADLRGADLEGAILTGVILTGADLRGADLRGADLRGADLIIADLGRVDLGRADLGRADLGRADLEGADLREANLEGANLREAYLEGANLEGANLRGADLKGANLEGAIWEGNKDLDKINKEYQKEIDELRRERLELLKSTEDKEELERKLFENEIRTKKLEAELEEKSQSKKALERIDEIFESLNLVKGGINKEHFRLKIMFWCYYVVSTLCISFLFIIWFRFFKILDGLDSNSKLEVFDFWMNISPSILLGSAIILLVNQAHKCQRQLLAVREFLYKHELIKSNMKSIIKINDEKNISKSISKVAEIFGSWTYQLMKSEKNLDTLENDKQDIDKKEKLPKDEIMDIIKQLINKI